MMIKTYVVDHLPDVYPMIFRDLGPEAFILNSKDIRTGGFLGLFGKKQVEVVAAADLSKELPVKSTPANGKAEDTATASPEPDVLKELSEVKSLIHSLMKTRDAPAIHPPRNNGLDKWVLHLEEHEVDKEVIQYIVKKAEMRTAGMGDRELESLLVSIVAELFEEGICREKDENPDNEGSPLLITLVGPTGVGKTTTIAKLAAARVFQHKQKVGLLTADTFRIAAVEQMLTYADILNIPLEVVMKADELVNAITALKGRQVIFMDTAGRNYLEQEYIEEINHFLRYDSLQENYLVLSMASRWKDMKKIVEQMKTIPIDKLILTKWDETTCFGAALNMVYHYPYPLSYLCTGQEVPQDIIHADAEYMAKKLLGVDKHAERPGIPVKAIV
ncbi:flagellar biosynthesis protein FlhF [Neobacillus notoginsengisoli]|uniref:Flagellar biosynthesis protein FlhF n=1 Tax=Neobacillus notoginsengisoli TaxID=1578198 RepID=A0A417YJK4_9BACI|nr:flagellar biosynthesis protein FlhF [Neobacillus notoginsengisoli]RHW33297.1 flagellar biosynthesis protein FlhF [Neobacillus notoginsengisoli]